MKKKNIEDWQIVKEIIIDEWHIEAVKAFGKKFKIGDFSKTVRFILTAVLNNEGFIECDYRGDFKMNNSGPGLL